MSIFEYFSIFVIICLVKRPQFDSRFLELILKKCMVGMTVVHELKLKNAR
jgi:hypothetical protein